MPDNAVHEGNPPSNEAGAPKVEVQPVPVADDVKAELQDIQTKYAISNAKIGEALVMLAKIYAEQLPVIEGLQAKHRELTNGGVKNG